MKNFTFLNDMHNSAIDVNIIEECVASFEYKWHKFKKIKYFLIIIRTDNSCGRDYKVMYSSEELRNSALNRLNQYLVAVVK